jgi:lysophospholipase L1-like esterase
VGGKKVVNIYMNTNPNSKRILCFGDSNTRGFVPLSGGNERFSSNIRWTGVLQNLLGDSYEIIEEGLDARRIADKDPREGFVGKNASNYITPCLESHKPLDLVILMLGTTDTKEMFNLTSQDIAAKMKSLINLIKSVNCTNDSNPVNILLLAPVIVDETVEFASKLFKGAAEKSKELARLYKTLAEKYNLLFLDLNEFVKVSSEDGVHLDEKNHSRLGEQIFNYLTRNSKIL